MSRDEFALSPLDRILEALALLTLVGGGVLIVVTWGVLPDSIPMHFDIEGSPDRYGAKIELLALWAVFAFTYLTMAVPARLIGLARRAEGQQWVTVYWPQMRLTRALILWFNVETMLLFLALIHGSLAVALGRADALNLVPTFSMCGVMAVTFVIWMIVAIPTTLKQVGAIRR